MKKIFLLISCFFAGEALAYNWTITNSTTVPLHVRIKTALPFFGSDTYFSELGITPGTYRVVDTQSKCVKTITVQAADHFDQATWQPSFIYQCRGATVDITKVNGLHISVN